MKKEIKLTKQQLSRYARHLVLPEIDFLGQERLLEAKVLCVGAGGLGSSTLLYLAAAGVGTIGIIDPDQVEESNLQRQILYTTSDVGKNKAEIAAQKLQRLNPDCKVNYYQQLLQEENAATVISQYDIVIDGSDNFATRYLVNDVCVKLKKPNIYGSVLQFEGQCSVFAPHLNGPCYHCLYPEVPPDACTSNCVQSGVLGVLPGIIGTLQATEAVKLILNIGDSLVGRLLIYDALTLRFREFKVESDEECNVCNNGNGGEICCCVRPLQNNISSDENKYTITAEELKVMLNENVDDSKKPFLLDVRDEDAKEIKGLSADMKIPYLELVQQLDKLAPFKERKIVVYCYTGRCAGKVVSLLRDKGFKEVYNLEYGANGWRSF